MVHVSLSAIKCIRYDESLEDVIDKICFSLNLRKKEINHEIIIYN